MFIFGKMDFLEFFEAIKMEINSMDLNGETDVCFPDVKSF